MKNDEFNPLSKILLGVMSAKFGPGVIGRIGTIAIAGMVVLTLLSGLFAIINIYISAAFGASAVVFAFYAVSKAFQYANRYPELSAMDGAQISRVLTQQGSMRMLEGLAPPPDHVVAATQNPVIDVELARD